MVEIAEKIGFEGGVLGSRMVGAGFGGSTVNLVRTALLRNIAAEMADSFKEQTGINAQIFATRPAQGAQLV